MRRFMLGAIGAFVCGTLVGCAGRQIEGWYDASRNADLRNYEGIVTAASYEPEDESMAALRSLGAIARARYQLDHLSANERGFERAPGDWDRMTLDVLKAHATWRLETGNHPEGAEMPDFMTVIEPGPLSAVDPSRIKITGLATN